MKEGGTFLSLEKLNVISDQVSKKLISNANNFLRLIDFQITLLEVLSYEILRFNRMGSCDFELAYVIESVVSNLFITCENSDNKKAKDLAWSIKSTLHKKENDTAKIRAVLNEANDVRGQLSNQDTDPLMQRLNKLRNSSSLPLSSTSNGSFRDSTVAYKYNDAISAESLREILHEAHHKVLLIDYRSSKDFGHNHIKHSDIVNIEPNIVAPLTKSDSNANDQDLEDALKTNLPLEQYRMFLNRHKYDLIVFYNFKYGSKGNNPDKYESLTKSLIDGNKDGIPSSNPFRAVMDLISFKNKYISSKLKEYPCYLAGGVYNWFEVLGEEFLERSTKLANVVKPPATLSRESSISFDTDPSRTKQASTNSTHSPYLKNFGDYLSTAKTTSNTPISHPFVTSSVTEMKRDRQDGILNVATMHPAKVDKGANRANYTKPGNPIVAPSSDNNIISKTKTSIIPKSKKSIDSDKFLEQYTTGLENLGNSCYMNCVLQCLGATPQLTKFFFPNLSQPSSDSAIIQSFRQHINVNNTLGSKGILTTNFVKLLLNMFNNSGKYFTPSSFKRVVGSLSPDGQFASFDQQDCIEFLTFLLDGLHEDLNQMPVSNSLEKKAVMELTPEQEKTRELLPIRLASTIEWERYLKLNFSIIVDYFQGQYLSHLKCLDCRATSTTYNAFSILSLPIPQPLTSSRNVSLIDCLNEFTATELLDDDNKWFCPNCKRFTKSTKKISITRLPQILIVHFKRFQMNPNGYFNKLDTFVTYPVNDVLDLNSYWPDLGSTVESDANNPQVITPEKEKEILSTLPSRNQQPPFRYKLYGVANHYGNLTTGHYTSYVYKKNEGSKSKGWCYFDDSKVTLNCKEKQVMNQNAYCLFYQRI